MSMHPKGPLPKKQQQVQVDLKQADTIKCKSCGNYLFIQSFILKKVSAWIFDQKTPENPQKWVKRG